MSKKDFNECKYASLDVIAESRCDYRECAREMGCLDEFDEVNEGYDLGVSLAIADMKKMYPQLDGEALVEATEKYFNKYTDEDIIRICDELGYPYFLSEIREGYWDFLCQFRYAL